MKRREGKEGKEEKGKERRRGEEGEEGWRWRWREETVGSWERDEGMVSRVWEEEKRA